MNRRNIFRLALFAVAASAMEVFGMKEVRAPEPKLVWRNHFQTQQDMVAYYRSLYEAYFTSLSEKP